MESRDLLMPAFAMAALTFVVMGRMGAERLGQLARERIHPQAVATSAQMAARLKDSRAADNFRNLFELPVLFYLALVVGVQMDLASPLTVGLAWAFVALRVVHSAIHCSYNKVRHRFLAYVSGGLVLVVLWGVLLAGIL
ncbi:MAPEG family protein [Arenimonas aestuarii]